MVSRRIPCIALVFAAALPSGGAQGQALSRTIFDCASGHCILIEAGPSFSQIGLEIATEGQEVDDTTGKGFEYEFAFAAIEPFKTSAYGANVSAVGLGSVRSATVHLALTPLPASDPEVPDNSPPKPSVTAELLAAIGHRRMASGVPAMAGRVDRFSYAVGLGFSLSPDNRRSLAGRMKWSAAVQYRRQYLPDVVNASGVRVDNLIVQGGFAGGLPPGHGFKSGLGFEVSGAYDFKRKVPGLEVSLKTIVIQVPKVVLGLRGWIQARDNDPRTKDELWDIAPQLSVKF
jgi:hypothetical protein